MMRWLAIIPSGGANWEVFYRPEKMFVIEVLVVFGWALLDCCIFVVRLRSSDDLKLVQGVPAKTATSPKVSFLVDTIAAVWPNNLNFRNSSDLDPILRALDCFENLSITVIEIEGWASPWCWTEWVNSASFKHFECWKLHILMAKGIRQGHSYCHNESCCRVHLALGVKSLLLFSDWERWAHAACVCFKRPRRTSFAHNGGLLLFWVAEGGMEIPS